MLAIIVQSRLYPTMLHSDYLGGMVLCNFLRPNFENPNKNREYNISVSMRKFFSCTSQNFSGFKCMLSFAKVLVGQAVKLAAKLMKYKWFILVLGEWYQLLYWAGGNFNRQILLIIKSPFICQFKYMRSDCRVNLLGCISMEIRIKNPYFKKVKILVCKYIQMLRFIAICLLWLLYFQFDVSRIHHN